MNTYQPTKPSSLVKSIGFTGGTFGTVEVWFGGNVKYRYYGVPIYTFVKMLNAKSVGKFYNSKIKGHYKSRKFKIDPRSLVKVKETSLM